MKQAQGFDHKSGQIPVPIFICSASVAIVREWDDYPRANRWCIQRNAPLWPWISSRSEQAYWHTALVA